MANDTNNAQANQQPPEPNSDLNNLERGWSVRGRCQAR